MSKKDLKNYLESLEKKDIIKIVLDTYSNNKDAKEFLEYLVNPDIEEKFRKAQKIILEEYFPEKKFPPNAKVSVAKRAISDFKKFNPPNELIAELMLFLVKQICLFIDEYGINDDPYYDIVENNYDNALKFIYQNKLHKKFKDKIIIGPFHNALYLNELLMEIVLNYDDDLL
ncbi:MAG: DUF6155 family protein [Methanobrevibacter sp.]|jgi:hypothetical protein|nr:DUF6155 family protein [Candidatus Methanoflexus mossambicus]